MNTSMLHVVSQLKIAQKKAQKELNAVTTALTVLTGNHNGAKRHLSKEARNRIAIAQRKRWAKVRREAA